MRLSSTGQDWLKILALVTMTIDHIGYFWGDETQITRTIGRAAFPLFAFLIGYNLTVRKANPRKYIQDLLLFGTISYPIMFITRGYGINIMFTLALGILFWMFLEWTNKQEEKEIIFTKIIGTIVFSVIGLFTEYSILGFSLIAISAWIAKQEKIYIYLPMLSIMEIITNILSFNYSVTIPGAFLTYAIIISAYYIQGNVRFFKGKILKYGFYAYYPVHFLLLFIISNYH